VKKVSVIVPFYSGVEWLCDAVQSILDQTYKDFEIIVVNDGSKEDLSEFLEKFKDNILYFSQDNQGASSARNLGIQKATGTFIAFLDSDDLWLPTKLEKQIYFMSSIGALWSHTNYYYWSESHNKLTDVGIKDEFGDIFIKSFISLKIATPTVIVSRQIFDSHPELKFQNNLSIGEDTQFWQDISKLYPIALITEPLVKVRLRGNNTFTRTLEVLHYRANYYSANREKIYLPKVAKIRGIIFYLLSKVFKLPSSPLKEMLARLFVALPYLIGRVYVKYLTIRNNKFKDFVL